MTARPKARLAFAHLDDRVLPSTLPILPPPVWWTESRFFPTATAAGENGSTWVVGNTQVSGNYGWWGPYGNDWGVAKLDASNRIDPTFNGGKVKDINAGLLDWFRAVQIQAGTDGKVYVLARNIARDAIISMTPFPTVVSDFSESSFVVPHSPASTPSVPPPPSSPAGSLADLSLYPRPYPLPNPIEAPDETYAVVRFNADGSLDATFNNDGIALFDLQATIPNFWGGGDHGVKFDVNASGQIAVAATQTNYYPSPFSTTFDIARLTADGQFDTTFDGDGKAQLTLPNQLVDGSTYSNTLGVHVADGGGISFGGAFSAYSFVTNGVGTLQSSFETGLFAARFTATGAADSSFGGDGIAIVSDATFNSLQGIIGSDLAITDDGEFLFVGTQFSDNQVWPNAVPPDFVLPVNKAFVAKIGADGELAAAFDGDGILYPTYETGLQVTIAYRLAVAADGDFLVAVTELAPGGTISNPTASGFAIVRHNADGSVDPSFTIVRETPATNGYLSDLDALSDGRIMAIRSDTNQLIAIDSDGVPATNVTIPYDRVGVWQPPTDWQPFPHLSVSYRETTADVTGDGVEDRIYVSTAGDRSAIRVVNGQTGQDLVADFQPYEDQFRGGMFVDAGDFDGDGKAEIVVSPDEGGSARIQVFTYDTTGLRQRANFFAIDDPNFRGGGSIGVLDLNEDGTPDLVVGAAKGGSQRIASFDGKGIFDARPLFAKLFGDYFAPFAGVDPMTYRGGVQLTTGDFDGNGREELRFRPSSNPANATVMSPSPAGFLFNLEVVDETLTFDPWNGTFVGDPAA